MCKLLSQRQVAVLEVGCVPDRDAARDAAREVAVEVAVEPLVEDARKGRMR